MSMIYGILHILDIFAHISCEKFFLIRILGKSVYSIYESHCLFTMGRICTHVVSPRARGKIILATGNQNFSTGVFYSYF